MVDQKRPGGDYWVMRDRASYPWARGNLMASQSNYVNAGTFGKSSWHFLIQITKLIPLHHLVQE